MAQPDLFVQALANDLRSDAQALLNVFRKSETGTLNRMPNLRLSFRL